jgi:ATP-dependent protease ClpP protease subunit
MLKVLFRVLYRSLVLIGLVALASLYFNKGDKAHQSAFTHSEIAKIKPFLIIDKYSLGDTESYTGTMQEAMKQLFDKGVMVNTLFGPSINTSLRGRSISLIIQSGGGLVVLGKDMAVALNSLRQNGIKLNCYVGEAQSMAFYLMVTSCDKVIAKKSATIMMHKTSYGSSGYTPATYKMDLDLSKDEAAVLGVDPTMWLNLTRGTKEDHVFTKEEIKKYKLVDEWID